MGRRIERRLAFWMVMAVLLAAPGSQRARAADEQCFPETGYCIGGEIRAFWEQSGGLAVFGFPIAPARDEENRDTEQTYRTQWFERNRLEVHPENQAPYRVQLGRLGDDALLQLKRFWQSEPSAAGPQAGCRWFEETSHNVCNQTGQFGFKTYWESHGLEFDGRPGFSYDESLALFGLPLTEPAEEVNSSGDRVLTQWFERARFEWHPGNPDHARVLLGRLGAEVRRQSTPFFLDELTGVGSTLFFRYGSPETGYELWRSDGTAQGTMLVKDIWPGERGSEPKELLAVGGTLFFTADDGSTGRELWRSDGTAQGTVLVKDTSSTAAGPELLTASNGMVYFVEPGALWRSDGTAAGTIQLQQLGKVERMHDVQGQLFLSRQAELWKSDGSVAGTVLVADIDHLTGRTNTHIIALSHLGTSALFLTYNGPEESYRPQLKLWRSDGTAAGTTLLRELKSENPYLSALTPSNGRLFFQDEDGLWATDGTPQGLVHVSTRLGNQMVDAGAVLFFASWRDTYTVELWKSDGTIAGTVGLATTTPCCEAILEPTVVAGSLLFFAVEQDGVAGQEGAMGLWRTEDGLAGATSATRVEVAARRFTPFPSGPAVAGAKLFFLAGDGEHGCELWKSDGTAAGTRMVRDLNVGQAGSCTAF